jgi:hypothetical protein
VLSPATTPSTIVTSCAPTAAAMPVLLPLRRSGTGRMITSSANIPHNTALNAWWTTAAELSARTAEITPTTEMMVNSEESSARDRTRWRKELEITRVVSVTADAYMSAWPVGRTPWDGNASSSRAAVAPASGSSGAMSASGLSTNSRP